MMAIHISPKRLVPLPLWAALASSALADDDRIPLPPNPPPASPEKNPGSTRAPTAFDRYNACFQKMVDQKIEDPAFLRKCLGLPKKRRTIKTDDGTPYVLESQQLEESFEKGKVGLLKCYRSLLKDSEAFSSKPEGGLTMSYNIEPSGKTSRTKITKSQIQDRSFLKCIVRRIATWKYPQVAAQKPLKAVYSLKFTSTSGGQLDILEGYPIIEGAGGLTLGEINQVFQKNVSSIQNCYRQLLRSNKKAAGKMTSILYVNSLGRVNSVRFTEPEIKSASFRKCLTRKLKKWRFPRPRGGYPVTVDAPLEFRPQ